MHQLDPCARAFESVIMHPGSCPDLHFCLFPADLGPYYYKVISQQRLNYCFA